MSYEANSTDHTLSDYALTTIEQTLRSLTTSYFSAFQEEDAVDATRNPVVVGDPAEPGIEIAGDQDEDEDEDDAAASDIPTRVRNRMDKYVNDERRFGFRGNCTIVNKWEVPRGCPLYETTHPSRDELKQKCAPILRFFGGATKSSLDWILIFSPAVVDLSWQIYLNDPLHNLKVGGKDADDNVIAPRTVDESKLVHMGDHVWCLYVRLAPQNDGNAATPGCRPSTIEREMNTLSPDMAHLPWCRVKPKMENSLIASLQAQSNLQGELPI